MSNDQLKSLQEMVETELADNKHSEYLLRLFASRENIVGGKSRTSDKNETDKLKVSTMTTTSKSHTPTKLDDLRVELKAGVGGMKHPGNYQTVGIRKPDIQIPETFENRMF